MDAAANETLARSSELLTRAKQKLVQGPAYLAELMHTDTRPVVVPFAPTVLAMDDTLS
jgi:hypothetical protein